MLDAAVGIELFDIGPQVVDLLGTFRPAKGILVPGILACGFTMYSFNVVSFQTIPEFLLASE